MTSVNNFLLVFNSSVNIVIYSFFNVQFRSAARDLVRPLTSALGCKQNSSRRSQLNGIEMTAAGNCAVVSRVRDANF
jgi:hypothetical protein